MFKTLLLSLFLLGCKSIDVPTQFVHKVIHTQTFEIASWQKITKPNGIFKFYIEGDGYAFNAYGQPTQNPTPRGTLVRKLAFGDPSPNVIYLARPCQYVTSSMCRQKYWTTARFAPEIIQAEYEAISQIAANNPVILIGFSGGAQVAGLVATTQNKLNIKRIITIAGNLDHESWVAYHNLPYLRESMNLKNYQSQFLQIPQIHYVGSDDKVIPPHLIKQFVGKNAEIIQIKNATHNHGWEKIYPLIQQY